MGSPAHANVPRRGVRDGFTTVTPYLMASDIEPVIAFAKRTFGASETMRVGGGGGGIHCELRIGDSMLMCGGGAGTFNPAIPTRLAGLQTYVDDVDTTFARALAAGGTSLVAPTDQPYGERSGFIQDPAGNHWYISKRNAPDDAAGPLRTLTPHLYVEHRAGRDAAAFIGFLEAALGAQETFRHDSTDGLVGYAVLRLGDANLAVGEGRDPGRPAPAAFYLYVEDCDALCARAVAAGAKGTHPPADQPHGDRMGTVEDPWGNEWFIATHGGP